MRKHGLTVDNLLAVDLVTADGERMRVDAETEPELFWGLRGGGGNFGIATALEYRLHPVGPIVLGGPIFWPSPTRRRSCASSATSPPRRRTSWGSPSPRSAPPLPFLPRDQYGQPVLASSSSGPATRPRGAGDRAAARDRRADRRGGAAGAVRRPPVDARRRRAARPALLLEVAPHAGPLR